jgi:uncharacterized membrane protein (UPF0127 family)
LPSLGKNPAGRQTHLPTSAGQAGYLGQNGSMNKPIISFLCALAAGTALAQGGPQLDLPRIKISAGMYLIDTQVAATPEQRATGLMYRQQMPQGEGMLFVFEAPAEQCFWMKNTVLPLSAAFVAEDGTIVNLADMKPQTTDSHCSKKPVRFVLEMNQGWFEKKGLKAGAKLGGVPFEGH